MDEEKIIEDPLEPCPRCGSDNCLEFRIRRHKMKITSIESDGGADHLMYAADVEGTCSLFMREEVGTSYQSLVVMLPGGGRLEFKNDGTFLSDIPDTQESARKFCEVVSRVWGMMRNASAKEDSVAEQRYKDLVKQLTRLENAATRVSRYGATPGPQWRELTNALLDARAFLKENEERHTH